MLKVVLPLLTLCASGGLAQAQSANEKPTYTYVADYGVPRAHWEEFAERWQKSSRPVLERLLADGTIVEFGASASVVHTKDGATHSFWWASPTIAGTQRVMEELAKNSAAPPPIPGMTHNDRLLRSVVYRARTNRITSGYSDINVFHIKKGKGEDWRKMYDKYTMPVMERMLEEGTILGYGVDAEYVHTENMNVRFGWVMYPNAQAIDKLNEAFQADRKKYSPDEVKAVMASFSEITDVDAHRDGMDRIIFWSRK
jgi:hypothetical protein